MLKNTLWALKVCPLNQNFPYDIGTDQRKSLSCIIMLSIEWILYVTYPSDPQNLSLEMHLVGMQLCVMRCTSFELAVHFNFGLKILKVRVVLKHKIRKMKFALEKFVFNVERLLKKILLPFQFVAACLSIILSVRSMFV